MVSSRMDELSAEVEVLEAKLKKARELTLRIRASVTRVNANGEIIDGALKQLTAKTSGSAMINANIDEAIRAIDRIRKPSDSVTREETSIRRGPQKTGLPEYFASLQRVNDGLQTLRNTNIQSSQKAVTQMTGLLKAGSLQLEDMFRQTLADVSKPVEPLHYITKDIPFPRVERDALRILSEINNFLSSVIAPHGIPSNTSNVYSEIRGNYITTTLSSLSLATINTARRADGTPYQRDTNGINTYIKALESLFSQEYTAITSLFQSSEWVPIFRSTIAPTLSVFNRTMIDVNTIIKNTMATDMCLAYELIERVTPVAIRLKESAVEIPEFTDSLKPVRQTAMSSFSFMFEDLKRSGANLVSLPVDFSVSELTIDTMARLERLVYYQKAVGSLLVSLGEGNWKRAYNPAQIPTSYDVGADGNLLLARFAVDMMDTLIYELETKSRELLKKKNVISVFMVNNVAYIERAAMKSDVKRILNKEAMEKVMKWKKDAVKGYMEQWKECAAFLMDVTYTTGGKQKEIKGKEKENVKEKFKSFNLIFEDLVQRHQGYNFPDKDVKAMLTREIGFIGPLYTRFYNKYKDVINPKHIKYDQNSIESILAEMGKS